MKLHHAESVSTCRNYVKGKCEYDSACWFVHVSEGRNNKIEVNEKLIGEDRLVLKRFVQMVEQVRYPNRSCGAICVPAGVNFFYQRRGSKKF